MPPSIVRLRTLHRELDACRACPNMIGPVVHGGPVLSTATSASLKGPVLDLENAPSGKYSIWVGSTSGNNTSGQIGITQSESNGP